MTQAPTPGPLSEPVKGAADGLCNRTACQVPLAGEPQHQFMDGNFTGGPRLHYCAKCAADFDAWDYRSGDAIRIQREPKGLAPTAPVEASGSVGLAASEIGEHIAKRDAEYESALADLTITPDASSLDEFGRSIFGALSDCPAMSIDKQADFVARALWPAVSALRPQPSGETREAGLDVFGDEVTDVQSRYIIVHQLRASADIQDEEIKRETGWATTTDRASLMRKAANTIERLALLSARPLALGGQHSGRVTADSLTHSVTDETMRALLSCKDVGSGRARLAAIINALSTTPARAEAQDEGAAGEIVGDGMPIGEGFLYRTTMTGERHIVHEATGFTIAKLPYDYRYTDNATQKALADKIVALYAHPSPTPAADDDRVRIAELDKEVERWISAYNAAHDQATENGGRANAARDRATAAEARADRLAKALSGAEETARRYARCYQPESDGRNTFLMLADHIAALQQEKQP